MAEKNERDDFSGKEESMESIEIPINKIRPFRTHPFKVKDDDRMKELVQSIRENGVLNPVLLRPLEKGVYEMVSGHRRMHAAKIAGLKSIPAIIRAMTDDEAIIAMIDSNLQREEILPSERAFSIKMKMDVMKRQGKRSDRQRIGKTEACESTSTTQWWKSETAAAIGKSENLGRTQVRNYVRLTELTEDLLDLVDQKKLPIVIAVEISYFGEELQRWIYSYIQSNGMIKKSQLTALKQFNYENLTEFSLIQVLNDAVAVQPDSGKVVLSPRTLDKYFSKSVTTEKRQEVILDLLEQWKSGRKRTRG